MRRKSLTAVRDASLLRRAPVVLLFSAVVFLVADAGAEGGEALQDVLQDEHARGAVHWIYNDLESAREEARKRSKPLFVTFRCVPCAACMSFDAEVANGNERIRVLAASEFVPVRIVEMKGVDLEQFQFDYDLNWAAMFLHADGTVLGRYGTQSAAGPDAHNSIEGLEKTMRRVLELHAGYPADRDELSGKRGKAKNYRTPLEMPGMDKKEKLRMATTRENCIHCHNIHDAEQREWTATGKFRDELLWRYPIPENAGFHVDPLDGRRIERVVEGSAAAAAGLRAEDAVTHMNGQAITSIADMQWVFHHLSNHGDEVVVDVVRGDRPLRFRLKLASGWKEADISWRGSMWSLRPTPAFWGEEVSKDDLKGYDLTEGAKAIKVRWINGALPEGRAAKKAGLRQGDILIGLEGKPLELDPRHFHMHVRMNYEAGENLPVTIWRGGEEVPLMLPLESD